MKRKHGDEPTGVDTCGEWLTTRNKERIKPPSSKPKGRSSGSLLTSFPRISSLHLTQGLPHPRLLLDTKQTKIQNFFTCSTRQEKAKDREVDEKDKENMDIQESTNPSSLSDSALQSHLDCNPLIMPTCCHDNTEQKRSILSTVLHELPLLDKGCAYQPRLRTDIIKSCGLSGEGSTFRTSTSEVVTANSIDHEIITVTSSNSEIETLSTLNSDNVLFGSTNSEIMPFTSSNKEIVIITSSNSEIVPFTSSNSEIVLFTSSNSEIVPFNSSMTKMSEDNSLTFNGLTFNDSKALKHWLDIDDEDLKSVNRNFYDGRRRNFELQGLGDSLSFTDTPRSSKDD